MTVVVAGVCYVLHNVGSLGSPGDSGEAALSVGGTVVPLICNCTESLVNSADSQGMVYVG